MTKPNNRKQRRAAKSRAAKNKPKQVTPTQRLENLKRQIDKLGPGQRAEVLTAALQEVCVRYAPPGDPANEHIALNSLLVTAATYGCGVGENEEVFMARARTLYQQTAVAFERAQGGGRIVVAPPPTILSPGGQPIPKPMETK